MPLLLGRDQTFFTSFSNEFDFSFRVMVVTEPLKVTITNFPYGELVELNVLNFPGEDSRGSRTIKLDSVIYIEKADFSEVKYAKENEDKLPGLF